MNFSNLDNSALSEKKKNITFFSRFSNNSRVLFIFLSALAITVVSFCVWFNSSKNTVLYDHLSYEDKKNVINQLQKMHIPYTFSKSSGKIFVPKNKIDELHAHFSVNDSLKDKDIGFELLDKEKFGISQFNERINYQRALEGELARTIKKINVIKNARIHIALPESSLFLKDQKSSSAAIILNIKPDQSLYANQVNSILHFLSRSIPDLSIQDITIVDQFGNLLNSSSLGIEQADNAHIKYISSIENHYMNRIKYILEPLLGVGNVHAQVTAQINFNAEERTQEQYSPNNKNHDQSMRSRQIIIHDTKEKKPLNDKTPSALSNTVHSLNNTNSTPDHNIHNKNLILDKKKNIHNLTLSGSSNINHEDIINYELDRVVSHTKMNIGEIKRLSAAVVVNYIKDKNGTFVCLKKEQLKNIKQLVHEAIGYSKNRGDSVYVMSSFFVKSHNNVKLPILLKNTSSFSLLNIFLFILLFLFMIFVIALIIRKYIFMSLQKFKKDIQEANNTIEKRKKESSVFKNNTKNDLNTSQLIEKICSISNKNPRTIASIIRKWMNNKI